MASEVSRAAWQPAVEQWPPDSVDQPTRCCVRPVGSLRDPPRLWAWCSAPRSALFHVVLIRGSSTARIEEQRRGSNPPWASGGRRVAGSRR